MAVVQVKVKTRSGKQGLDGLMSDGTLKLRVSAAPVNGQANRAVLKLLSQLLRVPESDMSIISGATSTRKLIRITGLENEQVIRRLKIPAGGHK